LGYQEDIVLTYMYILKASHQPDNSTLVISKLAEFPPLGLMGVLNTPPVIR